MEYGLTIWMISGTILHSNRKSLNNHCRLHEHRQKEKPREGIVSVACCLRHIVYNKKYDQEKKKAKFI